MPEGHVIQAVMSLYFTGCCRIGMRIGFAMRQQSIAAVYAKALRLNSSSIADVSPGKVTKSKHTYSANS